MELLQSSEKEKGMICRIAKKNIYIYKVAKTPKMKRGN